MHLTLLIPLLHASLPDVLSHDLGRLLLAAVLGGIIGIERELKHRPAGLRTNLFICFGAAMFTVLSVELAGAFAGSERTRIASQIIPGIGFIGAGSILHAQKSVTGLTTAATIFVVASIGMACGGGLYWLAVFATLLLLACLQILGGLERRFNLKPLLMHYSIVTERAAEEISDHINSILEAQGKQMEGMKLIKSNGGRKITFTVDGTRSEHELIMSGLRQTEELRNFEVIRGRETE
jgi:putative Mg2+ transporter-C (MgtC) family protein